ncbi:hypothetical protein JHK82_031610 [Glycine max]|nr:hypothetical protein JHK85_032262 [Glycine max]KAG5124873.1 hypothetical protein JHK82_031610 [Glycine max]
MGILRSLGEEKRVKGDSRDLCLFWDGAQDNQVAYQSLKFLEELDGKIPIVHVEDVCEAHIFCAENWSINGRFLVASSYASSVDIANYYLQAYPEFHLNHKCIVVFENGFDGYKGLDLESEVYGCRNQCRWWQSRACIFPKLEVEIQSTSIASELRISC